MDKKFKVLMLNGSPRQNGNIALAFHESSRPKHGFPYEEHCIRKKRDRTSRYRRTGLDQLYQVGTSCIYMIKSFCRSADEKRLS